MPGFREFGSNRPSVSFWDHGERHGHLASKRLRVIVGVSSGHVFGTALGAPLLAAATSRNLTHNFIGRVVVDPTNTKTDVTLVMTSRMSGTYSPLSNSIPIKVIRL